MNLEVVFSTNIAVGTDLDLNMSLTTRIVEKHFRSRSDWAHCSTEEVCWYAHAVCSTEVYASVYDTRLFMICVTDEREIISHAHQCKSTLSDYRY